MTEMLVLAAHLPEVTATAGEVLCTEGQRSGAIWVLVSGTLVVTRNGHQVNVETRAGAVIGEMAVMLDKGASATVMCQTPAVLRYAADGSAFLRSDPEVGAHVATGLARRLDMLTTYLADLKHQYGDEPGLAMVGDVLRRLAWQEGPPAQSGSARDPDPEY